MIKKRLQDMGLTPAKAILIAVLILVFVGVMLSNFVGGGSPATELELAKRPSKVTKVSRKLPGSSAQPAVANSQPMKKWPKIALDQAIAHDPFALPLVLRPKKVEKKVVVEQPAQQNNKVAIDEAAERQRQVQELERQAAEREALLKKQMETIKTMQESGIGIALVTPEEQVIKIGNKKLKVGDMWDGFRIVEIRANGEVVVAIE